MKHKNRLFIRKSSRGLIDYQRLGKPETVHRFPACQHHWQIDTKENEEEVRSPFPKQLQPLPAYPFSASQ